MKRQYLIIGIVVSILILLVFFQITHANDAPVKILGGGATPSPLTGPITENIAMESEVVRITLGERTFVVDARFVLNNFGNAAELWVGFPKRGLGRISHDFNSTSDFITFETWVNEEKVQFTEEAGLSSIEGVYTLPDLNQ
jgi:hypothetical protein